MSLFILKIQVIYTALMSGFMLMYVITLGEYFNYILKYKMFDAIKDYSKFRENSRVKINHSVVLVLQVIISIVSINFNKGPIALLFSILVPIFMLILHITTGFMRAEELVVSNKDLSEKTICTYIRWNKALHIIYTLLYILSAFLLINV